MLFFLFITLIYGAPTKTCWYRLRSIVGLVFEPGKRLCFLDEVLHAGRVNRKRKTP